MFLKYTSTSRVVTNLTIVIFYLKILNILHGFDNNPNTPSKTKSVIKFRHSSYNGKTLLYTSMFFTLEKGKYLLLYKEFTEAEIELVPRVNLF